MGVKAGPDRPRRRSWPRGATIVVCSFRNRTLDEYLATFEALSILHTSMITEREVQ